MLAALRFPHTGMAINDFYSKRQRRARGEMPDVFQYDFLPNELRMQIVYVIRDMFASTMGYNYDRSAEAFERIHHTLCREYGCVSLSRDADPRTKYGNSWDGALTDFAVNKASVEQVLDLIEAAFQETQRRETYDPYYSNTKLTPKQAAEEINIRFKERGAGYQYEKGEIIRVDSQYLHSEAVKPALTVLADKRFAGANAEFLKAHEHYRHGRNGEAMNECLKALESTLKVICRDRNWTYKETDQAKTLIDTVFKNGLLPPWLESQFGAVRASLESGVPTARNKVSGHGAGAQPREVPDYFAAYLLHLTATAIVFLAEADKATRV